MHATEGFGTNLSSAKLGRVALGTVWTLPYLDAAGLIDATQAQRLIVPEVNGGGSWEHRGTPSHHGHGLGNPKRRVNLNSMGPFNSGGIR